MADSDSRKFGASGAGQKRREATNDSMMVDIEQPETQVDSPAAEKKPEGLDPESASWGDYPIDDVLIRQETRTVYEVIRRIEKGSYIMDPDFQRDFVWPEDKQSKLIESVVMRIPLPVFYLAEDEEGRMIVVDGLQRLSTFRRFVQNKLRLRLPGRTELDRLQFSELRPKLKNRIEDCNLIFYIIDSTVPERARLDIFERVNSGLPLTRQQMRNSLFMGPGTDFLKKASHVPSFLEATRESLSTKMMRDREFINRFCAFRILYLDTYRGDMDDFLANALRKMNEMSTDDLNRLSGEFEISMTNNRLVFGEHAFSKSFSLWWESRKKRNRPRTRKVINASIWDVMSTGLSRYGADRVKKSAGHLRESFYELLKNDEFVEAITISTNDSKRVQKRFHMSDRMFREVIGAYSD